MSQAARVLVVLAALAVALLSAVAARAEVVTRQDGAGRTITFDVLAPAVDVDWYATTIANAAHGDEITQVTVRIVPTWEVEARCGQDAAACYSRRGGVGTITIPAGKSASLASILLHEYGHHLDANRAVSGVSELNGTPGWWASRGMEALLHAGTVAFDYSLGWEHSIGEVFAEDYAYVHTGGWYSIPWLAPPDEALQAALLAELGGLPAPAASAPPAAAPTQPVAPPAAPPAAEPEVRPVVATRAGVLAPRGRVSIPFRLLDTGRRVTVTGSVAASRGRRSTARLEVVCGSTVVRRADLRRTTSIDVGGLGPSTCRAALVSTSPARLRYSLRLRLTPGR